MVSVIIPIYNGAPYLRRCLESVTAQSCRDLQILLIDDGSTDGSRRICGEFAAKDSRIRFCAQNHAGVSAARNRGLSLAEGAFVLFVDADDLLPPRAAEDLLSAAAGVDLVIGSHREFRGCFQKSILRTAGTLTPKAWADAFETFDAMLNTLWGKLYRRQVIENNCLCFDEGLPYCEDHVFNLDFARRARSVRIIEPVCYRYRLGGAASSLEFHPSLFRCETALLEAYRRFFDGQVPDPIWKAKCQNRAQSILLHTLVHRSYRAALEQGRQVSQEPERLLRDLCRKRWRSILRKRIKIALWRRFGKRI